MAWIPDNEDVGVFDGIVLMFRGVSGDRKGSPREKQLSQAEVFDRWAR